MTKRILIFHVIVCITLVSNNSRADIRAAVEKTIQTNTQCKKIGDFYWEIGTPTGLLLSASVGSKYRADTEVEIASASKWIFGAYVLEKTKGNLTPEQKSLLQMSSGYTNMKNGPCIRKKSKTVSDCFHAKPVFGQANDVKSVEYVGKFYYNGAHAQALAVQPEMGLEKMTTTQLATEINDALKLTGLHYNFPQLAGGVFTSAKSYSKFLQQMLQDKYYMSKTLTTEKGLCANTACGAAKVIESPAPEGLNWWYGNHYWIEKSASGNVEALSSAGLFGFYPWITADKKFYGILSRKGGLLQGAQASVLCGRAIRETFLAHIKN